jgi:hypothetical protein
MILALGCLLLLQARAVAAETEALPFDVAALRKLDRVEVRVKDKDNKAVVYRGVPLSAVLRSKVDDPKSMAALRSLSDSVLLVYASDGYQVAVSAAAVAMDQSGERYLLALERDGQPLDEKQAPAQLIIPGDSQHVRWIRMISGVDLVRLRAKRAAAVRSQAKPVPER